MFNTTNIIRDINTSPSETAFFSFLCITYTFRHLSHFHQRNFSNVSLVVLTQDAAGCLFHLFCVYVFLT